MLAVYGGTEEISATYWLLGSSNDLQDLGRQNPDGAGIGWFDADGTLRLDRAPVQAADDPAFTRDAKTVCSRAVLAHVRYSSGTPRALSNTMPFAREGRLFAQNGALGDLPTVEKLAGPWAQALVGDTDSERYLALITRRAAEAGDLAGGVGRAAAELAVTVPVASLNVILATPDEVVALRYPAVDTLWMLVRPPGPGLRGSGSDGPIEVSGDRCDVAHVVIASEPLDDDPGWRPLESGELVHIDRDLQITSTRPLTGTPAFPMKF